MMNKYLDSTTYIDWQNPQVRAKALELAAEASNEREIINCCFEFVRDQIQHSWDYRRNPVTCTASQVLMHGTGFCYAKSHLLAALLRANKIPAGLCYQRLTITDNKSPLCLHGLNAVYLQEFGWYRLDARGNKPGVDAAFCPPTEQLAYSILAEGEHDFTSVLAEPLAQVVNALEAYETVAEVARNLPDVDPGLLEKNQYEYRI